MMRQLSNLPPGVTDSMIEEQAGGDERCGNCAKAKAAWSTKEGKLLCLRTLEEVGVNQDACEWLEWIDWDWPEED